VVVIAGGTLETARLLLLSTDSAHPNGLGNQSGLVGKNLTFTHTWRGDLHFKEKIYPLRSGPPSAESHQFLDPPTRTRHGGVKIEFYDYPNMMHAFPWTRPFPQGPALRDARQVAEAMNALLNCRLLQLHAETAPGPEKEISLSPIERDRFGDPFLHVKYGLSDFDHRTYEFCASLFDKFAHAVGATGVNFVPITRFDSGHHHLGTCRMGSDLRTSVVDSFGRIPDLPNLFVVGGSTFVGSGSVNPTLTMVALAFRTFDYMLDQVL
jgi:choline dehydrogenase-like flavoprotein